MWKLLIVVPIVLVLPAGCGQVAGVRPGSAAQETTERPVGRKELR